MPKITLEQLKKEIKKTPPAGVSCPFPLGQQVLFTNEAQITFGPYNVIGFSDNLEESNGRYIYIDSEAYWFPEKAGALSFIGNSLLSRLSPLPSEPPQA